MRFHAARATWFSSQCNFRAGKGARAATEPGVPLSKRRISGEYSNLFKFSENELSYENHPHPSGSDSRASFLSTYKIPAPGVPHIHFRFVDKIKSTCRSVASNGINPAACVMSTPIMLPISRPYATSGCRSERADAVDVIQVKRSRATSLPQDAKKSEASTEAFPFAQGHGF